MAIFPTHTFNEQQVKIRQGERYLSEATSRKFLGIPRGVYLGFVPNFSGDVLTLSPDPTYEVSFARLTSSLDPLVSADVIVAASITLDFTGHVTYPVNVVLKVDAALGQPHQAQILTQIAAPVDPTEILLCRVTAAQTVSAAQPTDQDNPYAYSSAPLGFGFMKSGAVEELLAAVDMLAEITAARTDLTGFVHPSLGNRLAADAVASAMGNRLGKEIKTLPGGDHLIPVSAASVNVSRAFSGVHRALLGLDPAENIANFGSESRIAAITAGVLPVPTPIGALSDLFRNVCAVIDATTEARLLSSSRQVAYGRLVGDEITLSGTLFFTVGLPSVFGIGTSFTTQIQVSDIIQDPNGNFYEVLSITDAFNLVLSVNALVTASGSGLLRRRFTLEMRIRTGPVDSVDEAAFSIPGGTTIRFFFPTWRSIGAPQFDQLPLLFKNFEDTPLPAATTSVPGIAAVAATAPEGKAGAIYQIQDGGSDVGPPHIHSIDFDGATDAGSGIANITQRGPTGIQGPGGPAGPPGPPGPQGPQGPGLTTLSYFLPSDFFNHLSLGSGANYSFTHNFGVQIKFLTVILSSWYSPFWFDNDDHFIIDDLLIVGGGTTAQANLRVPIGSSPAAQVQFAFNAAS